MIRWPRRRRAAPPPDPPPDPPGSHHCDYREVLEGLIAWLYGQGSLTVSRSAVLALIGAAEPGRMADPVTGCLPVTAESPRRGAGAGSP